MFESLVVERSVGIRAGEADSRVLDGGVSSRGWVIFLRQETPLHHFSGILKCAPPDIHVVTWVGEHHLVLQAT